MANRRHRPADTPLDHAARNHLETFVALCREDWEDERISPPVKRELHRFLERDILHAFVRSGSLGKDDRKEMQLWNHGGGFSLDATVCIAATD